MKKIATLMLAVFALSGTLAHADNHSTGVVQVFGCSLHDGRTMMDAREILRDMAANAAAVENPDPRWGMFVWLPARGTSEADFILGVSNSDLRTMAAGASAYAQSAAGQALTQRMRSTADCGSAIMSSEQIADGTIGMTADMEMDSEKKNCPNLSIQVISQSRACLLKLIKSAIINGRTSIKNYKKNHSQNSK